MARALPGPMPGTVCSVWLSALLRSTAGATPGSSQAQTSTMACRMRAKRSGEPRMAGSRKTQGPVFPAPPLCLSISVYASANQPTGALAYIE